MKTILRTLAVAWLFCLLANSPSGAQTNSQLEAAEPAVTVEIQKLQLQKDLESDKLSQQREMENDRLGQQKEIAKARYDSVKAMVHDVAWNSWVLVVIVIFFLGYLKNRRRHETIRLMIEKGTPITPELLDGLHKGSSIGANSRMTIDPRGFLRWGITLTLVGFALLAFHGPAGSAGGIVLAVGVADLILWFIEKASSNNGQAK